jgi:hypothetical protein
MATLPSDMTGAELIRRRAENRCIRCGSQRVGLDPETGFVKRLCDSCEREDKQIAIQQRGGASSTAESTTPSRGEPRSMDERGVAA